MPKKKNTVRADGRISVQVYLGRDADGKRKYKTVYGSTQKETDAKAEQVRLSLRKGLDVAAENDTFGEWAERWMSVKKTAVCSQQAATYKSLVAHLNRHLKFMPIAKIRPTDIQSVVLELHNKNPNTNRPAAKKTLKAVKMTASQIFRLAIENRVMEINPAQSESVVIPVDAPAAKRRALTDIEREWVHDTYHDRAQVAAMVMMYAGLRRGELIPLMWSDIDFKSKTISINKAVEKKGSNFEVKDMTKTIAGLRTVDIPQKLVDYLKTVKRKSLFVCCSASNAMHTETSWRRMWDSYLKDLNIKYGDFTFFEKKPKSKFDKGGVPFMIPRITPHWLRHTFATLLYFAGVDVLTAKEQMGHADVKTILEIYTHLDKIHKRKAMDKLDGYLSLEKESDASQVQVNVS